MRLGSFAFALLVLALLRPCVAVAQAPNNKPVSPPNAALQYWQAFSQMPPLDDKQEQLLQDLNKVDEWHKIPLDPEAQKLIAASYSSLMYLHRGAKIEHCDWGLDYDDGISMLLPYLAKARDLARLAALRARSEMEQGHYKQARADLTAMMALARHAGSEPTMICQLVRFLLEGMVVDLVAPYVPDMKAPHDQAVAMFKGLPPAPSVLDTIPAEKKFFMAWMAKKLREEEQRKPGAGLALWKNFLEGVEVPEAVKHAATVDEAVLAIESILPVYDELARLAALPPAEFDAQYPSFKERTKAANPLAGTLLPNVDQLLAKERRNQVRLEMLLAAVAVAESGPEALKDIKDPFGSGPFEYRALDKGFELKSKLLFEGQPVTLTVGNRAKSN